VNTQLERLLALFHFAFKKRYRQQTIIFEYLIVWTPEQTHVTKFVNLDNQSEYL
jgi:hypothetical protein